MKIYIHKIYFWKTQTYCSTTYQNTTYRVYPNTSVKRLCLKCQGYGIKKHNRALTFNENKWLLKDLES